MKRIALLLDYLYAATFQLEVVNGLISTLPENTELYVMIGGAFKVDLYDPFIRSRNRLYELITKKRFDGIIACTTVRNNIPDPEAIAFLDRFKDFPIVFFGPGPDSFSQVLVDNSRGMCALVRHFAIDHGYKRIAYVSGPADNRDAAERFSAYKQVLGENGIPFDPSLVFQGNFHLHDGIEAVRVFLDERGTNFDAIIAANDMMALGVKSGLESRGYSIPSDVAIAGFDDSIDATCVIPSLTSVRQQYRKMGSVVFDTMSDLMEGKTVPRASSVPADLVIRQSCGCVSSGKNEKILYYDVPVDTTDIAGFLKEHRRAFLKRLEEILAPSGVAFESFGIDTLLDTAEREMSEGSDSATYSTIQKIIMSSISRKMKVEVWQDVLMEIRYLFSPLLSTRERINRAEGFFHKARLVISDIQAIQKNQNTLNSRKQTDQMGVVSESLIDAIEMGRLRDTIYRTFPIFNIRNFLFAEFIDTSEKAGFARLVALIENGKGRKLDEESVYDPADLYPENVKGFDSGVYFMTPVTFEDNYMGYAIYEEIEHLLPFYAASGGDISWSFYYEKTEGMDPFYQSLTRDIAKSYYICKLIKLRKETEESLVKLAANLEFRNKELQDFAHIASHDLKEPLRKITFFSDTLKKMISGKINEEELDHLSRMQHAAIRMEELIDGLLAYSRITTKQQPFSRVDLAHVIAEVLQDLEARISETNGRVEVGELPAIDADPLQMRQLFQNLIGNALKYHATDAAPVVVVSSATSEGICEITVADNGIGFDQSNCERIFGIFQRLVGKSEYEGTGVGLAICKKIVEHHGGTIAAFGEKDKGARFVIRMRLSS